MQRKVFSRWSMAIPISQAANDGIMVAARLQHPKAYPHTQSS